MAISSLASSPSQRKGKFHSLQLPLPEPPDRGGLQWDRRQTQKEQLLPLEETSQHLWGLAKGQNPSFGATSRDKGICAVLANTCQERNAKPSLGAQRLSFDLMLWPQMTAYRSRRQSRHGDSPEANLALAISAATGAERPFLFGDTAAAGGGWLRWGLCQERSEMHCSQCLFLLSQGFSRLKQLYPE